ncbi:MAG: type pilus assembly protein PilN [Actinomycetota bacterium]|jgi:Tfp pilus assembly protein PilN|nr:type pilus assembly protein PilN [Actinomycetota bacterium]
MSTLTTVRSATLPRVNLLPPEIEQARRVRKVQGGLGVAVVAALAVVAGLFVLANNQVNAANDDLASSKATGTQLEATAAQYSDVPLVYAQVDAAEAQLSRAMGKEIRWSFFLNDLSLKTPNRVWLSEMTVATTDASAVAPAASATYLSPGIGTVQLIGHAKEYKDVATWLDTLAKQKGFAQPYFTNAAREKIGDVNTVHFDSKVSITEDALSKRYIQKAGS